MANENFAVRGLAVGFFLIVAVFHSAAVYAQDCPPARDERLTIHQRLNDLEARQVAIVSHLSCPGLYMYDSSARTAETPFPLVQIVSGWWFDDFIVARWMDDERTELQVRARFITGIGPTGVEPFAVQVDLRRDGDDWFIEEPALVESEFELATRLGFDLVLVENETQLENLGVNSDRNQADFTVDFSEQRLVIFSRKLTSGSMRIHNQAVFQSEDGYLLSFDVRTPRIGTTDILPVLIWWAIPDDGREVELLRQTPNEPPGERLETDQGVIYGASMGGSNDKSGLR